MRRPILGKPYLLFRLGDEKGASAMPGSADHQIDRSFGNAELTVVELGDNSLDGGSANLPAFGMNASPFGDIIVGGKMDDAEVLWNAITGGLDPAQKVVAMSHNDVRAHAMQPSDHGFLSLCEDFVILPGIKERGNSLRLGNCLVEIGCGGTTTVLAMPVHQVLKTNTDPAITKTSNHFQREHQIEVVVGVDMVEARGK